MNQNKKTHMCWRQWVIEPLDYYHRGHNHQDKDKRTLSPLDWINERILVLNMNELTNKCWSIINLIKFEIIRHNFSIHFVWALKWKKMDKEWLLEYRIDNLQWHPLFKILCSIFAKAFCSFRMSIHYTNGGIIWTSNLLHHQNYFFGLIVVVIYLHTE
jgi:hypothetical protein